MRKLFFPIHLAIAARIVLAYPTGLNAATALWTGESSGADTWSAPANWLANYRPMNGDDVIFGPSARTISIDNIALLTIATLGFSTNAPAVTIHIGKTSSLTISGAGVTKAQSGQLVTASNFRTDVNVNGSINASDIGLVKARSGTAIP